MLTTLGKWVRACCCGEGRGNEGGEVPFDAQDLGKHGYGEFSMASVQANQQNEDSFHIEARPAFGGVFVGIFDGHGGHEASQFIRNHLFAHLTRFVSVLGGMSEKALRLAFKETERGFEARVSAAWPTNPHLATVGSCALIGVVSDGKLYIANLGDSRAVLGRLAKSGRACTSLQMSSEHNVGIESVREEMKSLHPDDPRIVSQRHGVWRVRGIIQVSRSIGDMYLKKQEFNGESLYERFRLSEPLKRPLLTSEPAVVVHELQPSDKFLILASDGLWDQLTNDEAVAIVNRHPHRGVARKLIRAALQLAAKKREVRFEDLQKIQKGIRRHFHDDITVVVVFLDQKLVEESSRTSSILRIGMMDSFSTTANSPTVPADCCVNDNCRSYRNRGLESTGMISPRKVGLAAETLLLPAIPNQISVKPAKP